MKNKPSDGDAFRTLAAGSAAGAGGDPAVLTELYQRYWQELCTYVRSSFGNGPPDPEDVVQAAFIRYATVPDRAAILNPRAFLYTTARNIVIDHRRHERAVARNAHNVLTLTIDEDLSEITPERVLSGKERLRQLMDLLERMPERQRNVVLLNRVKGQTVREIADYYGMAEDTVRKQISRAIASCLKHLKDPDVSEDVTEKDEAKSEKLP